MRDPPRRPCTHQPTPLQTGTTIPINQSKARRDELRSRRNPPLHLIPVVPPVLRPVVEVHDLTPGTKVGELTVLRRAEPRFRCRCSCGRYTFPITDHVIAGLATTCGLVWDFATGSGHGWTGQPIARPINPSASPLPAAA